MEAGIRCRHLKRDFGHRLQQGPGLFTEIPAQKCGQDRPALSIPAALRSEKAAEPAAGSKAMIGMWLSELNTIVSSRAEGVERTVDPPWPFLKDASAMTVTK